MLCNQLPHYTSTVQDMGNGNSFPVQDMENGKCHQLGEGELVLSLSGPVLHEVSLGRQKSPLLPAVIQPLVVDNVASSGQAAQELDRTTDLGNEGTGNGEMGNEGTGNGE